MSDECPGCENGYFIFAPLGFRVLFRNDWECCMTDKELERYERSHISLIKVRTAALRDFLGITNQQ